MNLPKFIAYVWIVSVLVSIVVAVDRRQPILQAFVPIKSFRAFCWQLVLVSVICMLAGWQIFFDSMLIGQQPLTWGLLLALLYVWMCLGAYLRRGK